MIHLGIDTSNYKTSLAAVDDNNRITANISEYLDVPKGERGLRQSDAFFKHSNRLPILYKKLLSETDRNQIASVGVSYAPRRVEGSYMPCFLAGVNMAEIISETLNIPVYRFSHQEGHAAAVIETSGSANDKPVLLMHLSGGTTEYLKCLPSSNGYDTEIVGGTLDISFGQLLDRFGVAAGLSFPSGMEIDRFASEYSGEKLHHILPEIRLKDGYFNLSGPETRLMEFARKDGKKDLISLSFEILNTVSDVLTDSADYLCDKYGIDKVYMAGGVASSVTIRKLIREKHISGKYEVVFGDAALSGDNAVGTAILAARQFKGEYNK